MADNYLQFSEVIEKLTAKEKAWVRLVLAPLGDGDAEAFPALLGDNGIDLDVVTDTQFWPEFQWDISDNGNLCLYSDEGGNLEHVAEFVRAFLARFRPRECWSLTWSSTCSKPRIGEFGGGGLFVTAKHVKFQNAHQFVDQQRRRFERKALPSRRSA